MNLIKRLSLAAALVVVVAAASTLLTGTPAQAARGGRVQCPLVYEPVTCSNGRTYSNQCFADAAKAKDCVPAGSF